MKITAILEFDENGSKKSFTGTVVGGDNPSPGGEEALADEVFAEVEKGLSFSRHASGIPDLSYLAEASSSVTVTLTDPMQFIKSVQHSSALVRPK